MFIRYKCTGYTECYFYDKDQNLITPVAEKKKTPDSEDDDSFFAITDANIEYFNFKTLSEDFQIIYTDLEELSNYKLNKDYFFDNKKIKFCISTILKKEQETEYYYRSRKLFSYFEAPNIFPDNNDSVFRKNFKNKNKNVYLSKYDPDYYPVLSISPPNFTFRIGEYEYTSDGKASELYEAFKYEGNIPNTLFLKPHCRQWNRGKILLTYSDGDDLAYPLEYECKYDYANRKLTVGGVEYKNVPHTITVCCQGAGRGGENGNAASISGRGGSAGGFIVANCFLGNHVEEFKIQVGRGGRPGEDGESSSVQIKQTINLESSENEEGFESEVNPTFVSYNGLEYTRLENTLSIIAEGGTQYSEVINNTLVVVRKPGNGKIDTTTTGYYRRSNTIKTLEKPELSSVFYKILFNAEGGQGGRNIWWPPDDRMITNAKGGSATFTTATFEDSTKPTTFEELPNIKATWSSDNTYSLEEKEYTYINNNLDSSVILGGSSLREALSDNDIYPGVRKGGTVNPFETATLPNGGGGGSSFFGKGGDGGVNGEDGGLGAGGGGGRGATFAENTGSGGNGGNGAVWLLW